MTTAVILPLPRSVFFGPDGTLLAGGLVYTYVPGTTTPQTTWQDAAEATPNSNPIVLDAAGSCLLYGNGNYQISVTDALGNAVPGYSGLSSGTPAPIAGGYSALGAPIYMAASGNYIPTPGMLFVVVEMVGGGGAGGSPVLSTGTNVSLGAPGGCGTVAVGTFTAGQIGASVAVVIGAAGQAVAMSSGGSGGTTKFGTLMTAPGGMGGANINNTGVPITATNFTMSANATGANLRSAAGNGAGASTATSNLPIGMVGGNGGSCPYGVGGAAVPGLNDGANGTGNGSGGSGSAGDATAVPLGGNGAPGLCIIQEFGQGGGGAASIGPQPYIANIFVPGTYYAGQILGLVKPDLAVTFGLNLGASTIDCAQGLTANTTISLEYGGVTASDGSVSGGTLFAIGYLYSGSTVGTISAAAISFPSHNPIYEVAPATPEPSLSYVNLNLSGTRAP